MPKLIVTMDFEIKTGPIESMPEHAKEVISNSYRDEILGKIPTDEYGFVLLTINSENVAFSYDFFLSNGKKNSKIEILSRGDETGLIGKIYGEYSTNLRAGVAQRLKPFGNDLDIRLAGLVSKKLWGGIGFQSMLEGYEDVTDVKYPDCYLFLPKVSDFKIK